MDNPFVTISIVSLILIINAASLPLFISHGFVDWTLALPLLASTAIGSHFGARLAIKKGSKFIRLVFVGLVCVMGVMYIV